MAARASCSTLRRESIKPPWGFRPVNLCFLFFSQEYWFLPFMPSPLFSSQRVEEKETDRKRQRVDGGQGDWTLWVLKFGFVETQGKSLAKGQKKEVLEFDRKYEIVWIVSRGKEARILRCWRGNLGATEWKRSEGNLLYGVVLLKVLEIEVGHQGLKNRE